MVSSLKSILIKSKLKKNRSTIFHTFIKSILNCFSTIDTEIILWAKAWFYYFSPWMHFQLTKSTSNLNELTHNGRPRGEDPHVKRSTKKKEEKVEYIVRVDLVGSFSSKNLTRSVEIKCRNIWTGLFYLALLLVWPKGDGIRRLLVDFSSPLHWDSFRRPSVVNKAWFFAIILYSFWDVFLYAGGAEDWRWLLWRPPKPLQIVRLGQGWDPKLQRVRKTNAVLGLQANR